jgi:regulator of protease activity HflC (stomatin/prohibitin superfamily)
METRKIVARVAVAGVLVWVGVTLMNGFKSIPAGHVGVSTLFGRVNADTYAEGLHFPVNPFYRWHEYDARQKTHKETSAVPSQDQLSTELDVSIQYRIIGAMAPKILSDTGRAEDAVQVHLVPKLRSVLREQAKGIKRAEDFFLEATQARLQESLRTELQHYLAPKGIEITDVLIRDIRLPAFIIQAIQEKKTREQEAQKQVAELERYKTEQQEKVVQAEAEKLAASAEAEKTRMLADAKAYEIEKISKAIADSPGYIQLQALQTLSSMSKDPAAKLYFLNGSSPNPLPLMHMGEVEGGAAAKASAGATATEVATPQKSGGDRLAGKTK